MRKTMRAIALFLCLVMSLSLFPVSVLAEGKTAGTAETVSGNVQEAADLPLEEPYTVPDDNREDDTSEGELWTLAEDMVQLNTGEEKSTSEEQAAESADDTEEPSTDGGSQSGEASDSSSPAAVDDTCLPEDIYADEILQGALPEDPSANEMKDEEAAPDSSEKEESEESVEAMASTSPVAIDEAHFPDDAFREYVSQFDGDQSGTLDEDELGGQLFDFASEQLSFGSIEGINYFSHLEQLDCTGCGITGTLNLSGLTELHELKCGNNAITYINLTGCNALGYLDCRENELSALGIPAKAELWYLDCGHNPLPILNIAYRPALVSLHCDNCQLKGLDLSACSGLFEIWCDNNAIPELNISDCTKLQFLDCYLNQISSLDLSNSPELNYLNCSSNQIKTLEIENNPSLITAYEEGSKIELSYGIAYKYETAFLCFDEDTTIHYIVQPLRIELPDCFEVDYRTKKYKNNPYTAIFGYKNYLDHELKNVSLIISLPESNCIQAIDAATVNHTITLNLGTLMPGEQREQSITINAVEQRAQKNTGISVEVFADNTSIDYAYWPISLPNASAFSQEADGLRIWNMQSGFNYPDTYWIPLSQYIRVFGTQTAFILWMAAIPWGGNCFGMSVYAARVWSGDELIPAEYNAMIGNDIYKVPGCYVDGEVRDKIELYQISQREKHYKNLWDVYNYKANKSKAFGGAYYTLLNELTNATEPLVITIFKEDGYHAVVLDNSKKPIEGEDGSYTFFLYDPSNPYIPNKGNVIDTQSRLIFKSGKIKYKTIGESNVTEIAAIPISAMSNIIPVVFPASMDTEETVVEILVPTGNSYTLTSLDGSISLSMDSSGEYEASDNVHVYRFVDLDYVEIDVPIGEYNLSSSGDYSFTAFNNDMAICGEDLNGEEIFINFYENTIQPGNAVSANSLLTLGTFTDNTYNKVEIRTVDALGETAIGIDNDVLTVQNAEDGCFVEVAYSSEAYDVVGEEEVVNLSDLDGVDIWKRGYELAIGVDIKVEIEGRGSVSGTGCYSLGETVKLVAFSDDSVFLGWYDHEGVFLSAEKDLSFVATKAETVCAKFVDYIEFSLEQDYLILKPGDTTSMKVNGIPDEWFSRVVWTWEPAEENIDTPPMYLDGGMVTAVTEGTVYVVATLLVGDTELSARCRIDVVKDKEGTTTPIADDVGKTDENGVEVNGVDLLDKTATVELYRTDYARLRVVPNLSQNRVQSTTDQLIPQPTEENTGAAVTKAFFVSEEVAGLFSLRVVDDRTLEIVPEYDTLVQSVESPKNIKGSYSSEIKVEIEGREFDAGTVKLTIKKNLPKIKAAAVKLNSWLENPTDEQTLVFTGGTVTAIEAQNELGWATVDTANKTVHYSDMQGAKKSGKLDLLLTVENWGIKIPVSVSISAASTAPKLKFAPASVNLKPGTYDQATAAVTFTPATIGERAITVGSVMEGTNIESDALEPEYSNGKLTVKPGNIPDDGKPHTYKVYLAVDGKDVGALTVKTLADKTAVTLTAKATGTIDTAIPNIPVIVTPVWKNYNAGGQESVTVAAIQKVKGKEVLEDVTEMFNIDPSGGLFRITAKEGFAAEKGFTYNAVLEGRYGDGKTTDTTVKLNIKESAKQPTISLALKASGFIDVLRPETTSIVVTPTIKNWFDYDLKAEELTFKAMNGSVQENIGEPFKVSVLNGSFIITAVGEINHSWKYSAEVKMVLDGKEYSKTVNLSIKQGTAKVTQNVKSVDLLQKDKYSSGSFQINPMDAGIGIDRVELDEKSKALYELRPLGNNTWEIHYKDYSPNNPKTGTVKLNVFLKGNMTLKANAVLSMKINVI